MKRSVILALSAVLAVAACNDQQEPNAGSQDQGAD
ncbi:MAG: lipoprotein, partial [Gemmatimonadales bacterium]